jgi:hypothetical protein
MKMSGSRGGSRGGNSGSRTAAVAVAARGVAEKFKRANGDRSSEKQR